MYVHLKWHNHTFSGRVIYAPKAIKNLILVKFDTEIKMVGSTVLLVYENNEWKGYSSPDNYGPAFIRELLQRLGNITDLVKANMAGDAATNPQLPTGN